MTVDEAKKAARKLELELLQQLRAFEVETGLTIEAVDWQRTKTIGKRSELTGLDVRIGIEL